MSSTLIRSYVRYLLQEKVVSFDDVIYDIDDEVADDIMSRVTQILRRGGDVLETDPVMGSLPEVDNEALSSMEEKHPGFKEAFEVFKKVAIGVSEAQMYSMLKDQALAGVKFRQVATDPFQVQKEMDANWKDPKWAAIEGSGAGNSKIGRGEPVLALAFNAATGKGEPDFRAGDVKFSVKAFLNNKGARTASGTDEKAAVLEFREALERELNFSFKDSDFQTGKKAKGSFAGSAVRRALRARWTQSTPVKCPPKEPDWNGLQDLLNNVVDAMTGMHGSTGVMTYDGSAWTYYSTGTGAKGAQNNLNFFTIDIGGSRMGFGPLTQAPNSNYRELIKPGGIINQLWNENCTTSSSASTPPAPHSGSPPTNTPTPATPEPSESKLRSMRSLINEILIVEEFSHSDRKEIERIAKKQAKEEIKKTIGGTSFATAVEDEIKKALGKRATKDEIAEITKTVLKKFYRELGFAHNNAIDRIRL